MICGQERIIRPEWLDDTPPERAAASLRDLVRINRYLGGHKILRDRLAELFTPHDSFSLLDVGAASGDTERVVRESYRQATVVSLDYRHHHVRNASPPKVVADAFQLPFSERTFDVVFCSLFLHHFTNTQIVSLLRAFGNIAVRGVLVSDLERHPLAYYFLPATRWLFGWDRITLHDGPISVEAAFRPDELKNLAHQAGLENVHVRTHRPAFRLSMFTRPGVL